jgi:hypothetical protein
VNAAKNDASLDEAIDKTKPPMIMQQPFGSGNVMKPPRMD